jgi:hypothetical protein
VQSKTSGGEAELDSGVDFEYKGGKCIVRCDLSKIKAAEFQIGALVCEKGNTAAKMSVLRHELKVLFHFGYGHASECVLPLEEAENNIVTIEMDVNASGKMPSSGIKKALAHMREKGPTRRKEKRDFFRLKSIHIGYVYELQPQRTEETIRLDEKSLVTPEDDTAPTTQVDSENLHTVAF